jgi:hypothetical protein
MVYLSALIKSCRRLAAKSPGDLPPKNWSTCKVIITPKAG